jgi:hypothetical protein
MKLIKITNLSFIFCIVRWNVQLYDVLSDPREENNLARSQPQVGKSQCFLPVFIKMVFIDPKNLFMNQKVEYCTQRDLLYSEKGHFRILGSVSRSRPRPTPESGSDQFSSDPSGSNRRKTF